jgi:hypothetical protein
MKLIASLCLVFVSVFFCNAQSEGVSPVYSFSIKKKIEPPILEIEHGSLRFVDQDGDQAIDANEACAIEFTLRNSGQGEGLNLSARLSGSGSATGITFASATPLEKVPVNGTRNCRIPVTAGMGTVDGQVEFRLEVEEPNGFNTDAITLDIATRKFAAPQIEVVDHTVYATDGSSNLVLKRPFSVQLLVQNTGQGAATGVSYNLNHPENTFITSGEEAGSLGTLAPGETRSLEFEMILNAKYTAADLPLQLELKESYDRYSKDWSGRFTLNQALAQQRMAIESKPQQITQVEVASLRSDVDKDIPAGLPVNKKKYALIIGNEDYSRYQPGLQSEVNVDFAINDARVFAEYCEKTLGVPRENITLLTDATKGQMSQAISKHERFLEVEKGQAEMIFYYSGHGLPEERTNTPYLIPVDVSGTQPANGIALMDVYAQLSRHPAQKVIVVLDACFSGGARSKELVAMKGVRVSANVSNVPANIVVLASSSGNEASAVFREKQHGYFTYFLLKELKESKGQVSIRDMMARVEQNVARETARIGKIQTPTILIGPDVDLTENSLKW